MSSPLGDFTAAVAPAAGGTGGGTPCLVQVRRKLEGSREKVLSFRMVTIGSKRQACPHVTAPSTGYMWLAEAGKWAARTPERVKVRNEDEEI